jgi:hypothetical protein
MSAIPYPFIDSRERFDDPFRPGTKLCPRCSKGGAPCCSIEPCVRIIFGQPVVLEQAEASKLAGEGDYAGYLCVCVGRCDPNGVHPNRI